MNMSFINLGIFTMTLFLMTFVFNISQMASSKLDLQNTVDEASISAATVKARGLNGVTAMNHLIGELSAFVVMHDAIGGERIYNRRLPPRMTRDLNRYLRYAKKFAGGVNPIIYRQVRQQNGFRSDKAVMEGKKDLKRRLTWVYVGLGASRLAIASGFPPAVLAGKIAKFACKIWEFNVGLEYTAMNRLEWFARVTLGPRRLVERGVIPFLKVVQRQIIAETPRLAIQSAQEVAQRSSVEIWIDRRDVELPVTLDPHVRRTRPQTHIPHLPPKRKKKKGSTVKAKDVRNQIAKTTQLARATYPWVLYHRKPILDWTRLLWNSRFSRHYRHFTFKTTVEWSEQVQRQAPNVYGLYVFNGFPTPNKGYATWNEHGADSMFTVTCIGWRETPTLLAAKLMGYQPRMATAVSQSMTYNANRQERMRALISPLRRPVRYRRQAAVGWDTLNYRRRMSEVVNDPEQTGYPEIRLNWQSKLVPIAASVLGEKIRYGSSIPREIRAHLEQYKLDNHTLSIR